MLGHYLKIALRHFRHHKGYSFINISGLAIGLACCILILIYVRDEVSYDRYHKNAKKIYRLAFTENRDYKTVNYPITSGGIAPSLIKEVPDVVNAVRFTRPFDRLVIGKDKQFNEQRIFYADASVFEVFSFSLIQGNAKTALAEPSTVVITQETARKYFGNEDPMGEVLTLGAGQGYVVTGVLREVPRNSHFRFDMLFSMQSLEKNLAAEWRPSSCYTYLMVKDHFVPFGL